MLGFKAHTYKNYLIVRDFNPVKVSSECSGIIVLLAYILTIQVLPVFTVARKLSALLLVPFILVGNLARVFITVLTGLKLSKEAMIFFHNTFSQLFLFFWAIFIYIAWLKLLRMFPTDRFSENLSSQME